MKITTEYVRNAVGFWFLGLCNNFAYVIMLSAAHDILAANNCNSNNNTGASNSTTISPTTPSHNSSNRILQCNPLGTGTILLADVLPSLIIKLTAPLFAQKFSFTSRVMLCIILAFASFLLVAGPIMEGSCFDYSVKVAMSLAGVVCAAASSGFGELTFLSFTSLYDESVVTWWSSGTGGAGIIGALSYAGLASALGLRNTLLVMLIIPALLFVSYVFILPKSKYIRTRCAFWSKDELCYEKQEEVEDDQSPILENLHGYGSMSDSDFMRTDSSSTSLVNNENTMKGQGEPSFKIKLSLLLSLLHLMIPLSLVYLLEYIINQSFYELILFNNVPEYLRKDPSQQYRWYQVIYQFGVFLSRSSVVFTIFHIRRTYVFSVCQAICFAALLFQVLYFYIQSIWIIFVIILIEGLFGGGAYVNTFFRISREYKDNYLEYCMLVASVGDTIGISLAAGISTLLHDPLCRFIGASP